MIGSLKSFATSSCVEICVVKRVDQYRGHDMNNIVSSLITFLSIRLEWIIDLWLYLGNRVGEQQNQRDRTKNLTVVLSIRTCMGFDQR